VKNILITIEKKQRASFEQRTVKNTLWTAHGNLT